MNQPLKILLVDDEAIVAMSLRRELAKAGFTECALAATGAQAIERVKGELFDAVVMDLHLAGEMDGFEAIERIRASNENIPVVFMSGYSDPDSMAQAARYRPTAYLVKPIDVRELIDALNGLLPTPPSR